jgi:hypothetical protein
MFPRSTSDSKEANLGLVGVILLEEAIDFYVGMFKAGDS